MLPKTMQAMPKQFKLLSLIRLLFVDLVRRIFDQHANLSYSNAGEDLIIRRIFNKSAGFYVDLGCNAPDSKSNTFALYKLGWTGICIDANEALIDRHSGLRPNDCQVLAAVSNEIKEVVFTQFVGGSQISSIDENFTERISKSRAEKIEKRMQTRTLTGILDGQAVAKNFDLLCIDVEGHDFEALQSLDFLKYRPRVIVIEILCLNLARFSENQIIQYLLERNYKFVGYVMQNAYLADANPNASEGLYFG